MIINHSGSYGLVFTVNQKWKSKIYKPGKADDKKKTKRNRDMSQKRWFQSKQKRIEK